MFDQILDKSCDKDNFLYVPHLSEAKNRGISIDLNLNFDSK